MRVLLTAPALDRPGGVASYYRAVLGHLGSDVRYLPVGSRSDRESLPGTVQRLVCDYLKFWSVLLRERCDLVHVNPSLGFKALMRDALLVAASKVLRKKVIVFAHGWYESCERTLRRYFLPLFRLAYFRADAFMVPAREFEERLRSLGFDRAVFVVRAAVEDASFDDDPPDPAGPAESGTKARFNILLLGRIETGKGIYEAIDAYRLLKAEFPCVSLTVAGDGVELGNARACAAAVPGISFVGHVTGARKREVFQRADVYLFPSHAEGLPISVLEAMAYGLPVVTTAVGGIRDFFEDGKMGFATESRDPEVLAALVGRLLNDPGLRAGIRAFNREYARAHFTAAQLADRLWQAYRSVAWTS